MASEHLSSPDMATSVEFPPHTPEHKVRSGQFLGNIVLALSMKHLNISLFMFLSITMYSHVSQILALLYLALCEPPFSSTESSIMCDYFGEYRERVSSGLSIYFVHAFVPLADTFIQNNLQLRQDTTE